MARLHNACSAEYWPPVRKQGTTTLFRLGRCARNLYKYMDEGSNSKHAYWGGWRVFPRLSWRSSFLREMRVHPRQVRGSVIKGGNAGGGKGVSPTRPAVRVVVRR